MKLVRMKSEVVEEKALRTQKWINKCFSFGKVGHLVKECRHCKTVKKNGNKQHKSEKRTRFVRGREDHIVRYCKIKKQ